MTTGWIEAVAYDAAIKKLREAEARIAELEKEKTMFVHIYALAPDRRMIHDFDDKIVAVRVSQALFDLVTKPWYQPNPSNSEPKENEG